jgi:hypothetical protein
LLERVEEYTCGWKIFGELFFKEIIPWWQYIVADLILIAGYSTLESFIEFIRL